MLAADRPARARGDRAGSDGPADEPTRSAVQSSAGPVVRAEAFRGVRDAASDIFG